jgi:hypothetical protein
MLTEDEIRRALHAGRVLPIEVENPHGPLGLEQLAAAVERRASAAQAESAPARVRRAIDLPVETWERLDRLAAETSRATSSPVRPSDLAATIIEEYLASGKG